MMTYYYSHSSHGISPTPAFNKPTYLFWQIDAFLEHRLPLVQAALDDAYNAVQDSVIEPSPLGKNMLNALDIAQGKLCQAGESARMIHNHLADSEHSSLSLDKQIQMLESALGLLHKGLEYVVDGISQAIVLAENYIPEASPTIFTEDESTTKETSWQQWLHHTLQLFRKDPTPPTSPSITAEPISAMTLSRCIASLTQARYKAMEMMES